MSHRDTTSPPPEPPTNPPQDDDADEGPQRKRFVIRRDPRLRLDSYLRQRLKHISRHQIQKLIELGGVTINGGMAKASATVHQHDVLDVVLPPPPIHYLQPQAIDIEVLYEDEHFIVINKQAGLVVHPARSHLSGTLLNALAYHFQKKSKVVGRESPDESRMSTASTASSPANVDPEDPGDGVAGLSSVGAAGCRPGIVHRLDKNTTGAMVVAKRDGTHWYLARQFEKKTALKVYLALVHGQLEDTGGVIDEPIGKHPTIREAYAVRHDRAARASVTLYRVRERYHGYCLLELELKTGRTHQIRVHLSHLGHPIAGDIVYGGEPIGTAELEDPPTPPGARRLVTYARTREEGQKVESAAARRSDMILATPALHATILALKHPKSQQVMTFTAPMHESMARLVRKLRRRPIQADVATQGTWVQLEKVIR